MATRHYHRDNVCRSTHATITSESRGFSPCGHKRRGRASNPAPATAAHTIAGCRKLKAELHSDELDGQPLSGDIAVDKEDVCVGPLSEEGVEVEESHSRPSQRTCRRRRRNLSISLHFSSDSPGIFPEIGLDTLKSPHPSLPGAQLQYSAPSRFLDSAFRYASIERKMSRCGSAL